MPGRISGFQALVRKKAPHIMWTRCMLLREAIAFRNKSKELQTVSETIVTVFNCVKNSPLR